MTQEQFAHAFVRPGRRADLWEGPRVALADLCAAGIDRVYIGGSYVTDKNEPGDVDGYWIVAPERRLSIYAATACCCFWLSRNAEISALDSSNGMVLAAFLSVSFMI